MPKIVCGMRGSLGDITRGLQFGEAMLYTSAPTVLVGSVSKALKRFRAITAPELPPGREWIYFLEAATAPILVRISASPTLDWRLVTAQSMCPVPLKLVGLVSAPAGFVRAVHKKLAPACSHAHWFVFTEDVARFIEALPAAAPLPALLIAKLLRETATTLGDVRIEGSNDGVNWVNLSPTARRESKGSSLGETTFDVYRELTA